MSRYDATQTNESTRSSRIFKDLNLDFQQNTATKDIQKIKDIEAVKKKCKKISLIRIIMKNLFTPKLVLI